jgi:nitrogen regulatory protein PII
MVQAYMTGRKITPEHEKRTKVETIVQDSSVNQIIDDLVKIGSGSDGHGMMFVKETVNVYEIGTTQSGELILTGKK